MPSQGVRWKHRHKGAEKKRGRSTCRSVAGEKMNQHAMSWRMAQAFLSPIYDSTKGCPPNELSLLSLPNSYLVHFKAHAYEYIHTNIELMQMIFSHFLTCRALLVYFVDPVFCRRYFRYPGHPQCQARPRPASATRYCAYIYDSNMLYHASLLALKYNLHYVPFFQANQRSVSYELK